MKTQLLIGTRKGGFVAESDASRRTWNLKGPFLKGCEVNHVAHLGDGRLAIAGKSSWWGPALQLSDDGGVTRSHPAGAKRFDAGRGYVVKSQWIFNVDPCKTGRLTAGAVTGARFMSDCGGGARRGVISQV